MLKLYEVPASTGFAFWRLFIIQPFKIVFNLHCHYIFNFNFCQYLFIDSFTLLLYIIFIN